MAGQPRKIKKIWTPRPMIEGAGVKLNRVFGFNELPLLDPFLLMDDFHSSNPEDYAAGFPMHPHRGIETITYLIEGRVAHKDSMGNSGVITPGDAQWMTAGSGIIHEEMPDPKHPIWGFQLWANLPAENKMMEPRYRDVAKDQIPEVGPVEGVRVKVLSGKVGEVAGPVKDIVTDPEYLDVRLDPKTVFSHPVKPGHTAFAYVIEGEGTFDPGREKVIKNHTLVLFDDGESVRIEAADSPLRFLFVSGRPLREPVAWYGPIVMNTREELELAFSEYQNGTFIKRPSKSPARSNT